MKNIKRLLMLNLIILIISSSFVFASIDIEYNIIPEMKINSVIDTVNKKVLTFSLLQDTDEQYFYDGKPLSIEGNKFTLDISNLSGPQKLEFSNQDGDTSSFNYFFSDNKGKLDRYELVKGKNLDVFVTTHKGIQIIYTSKEATAMKKLKTYIDNVPNNMLVNLKSIKMIPFSNYQKIAGNTQGSNITLYNFKTYATATQKNIIFHEITHTWANDLMDRQILDYSYTDFKEAALKDKNYVSEYAKTFAGQNDGRISEDFAESFAFYLINQKSFSKSYPNRTAYMKSIINL